MTAFGSWPRGAAMPANAADRSVSIAAHEDGPPLVVIHRPGARQSTIVVGARVAAAVAWPALREIREIAGIDSVSPTAAEVESSARFVIASALMRRASRSGWADEVDENRSVGKAWGDSDSGLRAILATTPAQLRSLVDRYLAPSTLTTVVEADTVALGEQMGEIRRASQALRAKR